MGEGGSYRLAAFGLIPLLFSICGFTASLRYLHYATGNGRIRLVKCYEVRETGLVKSDWLNQIS